MDDVGWSTYTKYYGYKLRFYTFAKGKMSLLSTWNWNIAPSYANVGLEGCTDDISKSKDYSCRPTIDGHVLGTSIPVNAWLQYITTTLPAAPEQVLLDECSKPNNYPEEADTSVWTAWDRKARL